MQSSYNRKCRVFTHISTMERAFAASATTGNDVIVSVTVQYRDVLTHEQSAGQSVTASASTGNRVEFTPSESAHAQK